MRVLFLGDSLGLPRPHRINDYNPDEKELAVTYDETYSSIIGKNLFNYFDFKPYIEIVNRSKRAYTIRDISKEFADHLYYFEPDLIVMQVGIVDCWFRENREQLVNRTEYEKYLRDILRLLSKRPNVRLAMVSIAPTSTKMDTRNPGLNNEIEAFNQILKSYENNRTTFFIDLNQFIDIKVINKFLLPDDHHLNKEGNRLLADLLIKLIKGLICSDEGVKQHNSDDLQNALYYFFESFKYFPTYRDNLYNLIILSYQLNEKKIFNQVVTYIEDNSILDNELLNIIAQLR